MAETVEELIGVLRDLFEARQAASIIRRFSTTIPIYSQDGVSIRFSLDETSESLRRLMQVCDQNNATRLDYEILAVERSATSGAMAVKLEWIYLTEDGKEVDRSKLTYFLKTEASGELRIQMVDYETRAFAEDVQAEPHRLN